MKKLILLRLLFFVTMFICNIQCQKQYQPDITKTARMANSTALTSTIVYTDVNPDIKISSGVALNNGTFRGQIISKNYNLDLNNDGTTDFEFLIYFRSDGACVCPIEGYVYVSPLTGTGDQVANNNTYPSALDTLAGIGSTLSWSGVANQNLENNNFKGTTHGNWTTGVKYLGLKFIKSGNIYYGWVRLYVNIVALGSQLTVMDYAYNSSPNQPILAGQTK